MADKDPLANLKRIVGELDTFVKGLSAGAGKALEQAGTDAAAAVEELGEAIDDLLKAPGRFAEIVKEIEGYDLAKRANRLLNQAQIMLNQSEQSVRELDITVQTLKRFPGELKKDLEERKKMLGALGSEIKNRAVRGFQKLMR